MSGPLCCTESSGVEYWPARNAPTNELRQALPLLSVPPEQVRSKVLDDIKSLKSQAIA